MYFIIFKPEKEFRSYSNQLFATEAEALDWGKRSFKRKDVWQVVPYNSENYNKYWYKT